ncbi:MAG: DUF1028 domain-containing protein [Anaerolineaceae bacterium]|nr:DUF1028 domain-containing protein [Anaerolineaceae bacterium]
MPLPSYAQIHSTYSIVAIDHEASCLGGAVQTHQMSVGARIPVVEPGIGVVNSQSAMNQMFPDIAITMLRQGVSVQKVVDALIASDEGAAYRQLAVLASDGSVAAYSGERCIREFGHFVGEGYSVQANMMTRTTVVDAMRAAFESAPGDLAQRMLAALQAAEAEAGDIRGMQSACVRVMPNDAKALPWQALYDLRVDDHPHPVEELARLVRMRHAQHTDQAGHRALRDGQVSEALDAWSAARKEAPELEELGFWQAAALADRNPKADSIAIAAAILRESVLQDELAEQWIDLIRRIEENGMLEREGAADELIAAIAKSTP